MRDKGKLNQDTYQVNWDMLKREWPIWTLLIGTLIAAIVIYPHLPDQVPIHWNIKGEVDNYGSRAFGAFMLPLTNIGLYLLMLFLPLIDPRRDNYARFAGAYRLMRGGMVLFFCVLYAASIMSVMGIAINIGMLVKAAVAVLFIIIGKFMGQMRPNYFVGIKIPWTLANEKVWEKTHRMGGRLWVGCGFLELALAPVDTVWGAYLYFGLILVMATVPILYSYFAFRKFARR
jgi:uncharacterized membrane protein